MKYELKSKIKVTPAIYSIQNFENGDLFNKFLTETFSFHSFLRIRKWHTWENLHCCKHPLLMNGPEQAKKFVWFQQTEHIN